MNPELPTPWSKTLCVCLFPITKKTKYCQISQISNLVHYYCRGRPAVGRRPAACVES